MAKEIPGFSYTLPAGSDLSASQHRFVTMAADGEVDQTGAGAQADGVLQNDPSAQGRAATIVQSGISKVVAGAAITRGALVASDATGRAVTAATGNVVLGRALDAATAAGEVIAVLLYPGAHISP